MTASTDFGRPGSVAKKDETPAIWLRPGLWDTGTEGSQAEEACR